MDAENQRPEFEDVDRWLDVALRERANAEPRSGLEERVLARLAAHPPRRAFASWQAWVAAAAIFVIVLTLALLYPRRQQQVTSGKQHSPQPGTQANKLTQPPVTSRRDAACCVSTRGLAKNMQRSAIGRPAIRTQPEALPKLATFPAPRPETREEHMLARLAARQGSYDLANASPDIVPLKDLSVPELKIEPMEGTPPDNTPQK